MMRTRATSVIVAAVILVALGIYLWHTFVPGPMAFAGRAVRGCSGGGASGRPDTRRLATSTLQPWTV
jgi:hypothetical protein